MSNSNLGERIRRARLKNDYTQAAVAEKLGVNPGIVSHWENETRRPNLENRRKLEELLGLLDAAIDFDGEFGRWLKHEREKQNMTLDQLSEKSGISRGGISHIETGRVANPTSKTMRKLAVALKVSEQEGIANEVIEEVEKSNEIEGLGKLLDFLPFEEKDIPDGPGVYILYDVSNRPIYVGQGQKISARIKFHQDKFWFKEPIVVSGAYITVSDDSLRKQLEEILIRFLKGNAVVNKHYVDR